LLDLDKSHEPGRHFAEAAAPSGKEIHRR
jgi:hypothetical protein